MNIDEILHKAMAADASDVHLIAGHQPMLRVHTVMSPLEGYEVITPEQVDAMFRHMTDDRQRSEFGELKDADFSYAVEGLGRFRVNTHVQRKTLGIAMRAIKEDIPALEELNLPEIISKLTHLPRGLVLVTGATGSGKSTTLASMIQAMNEREQKHILTLEDPIEYAMKSAQCVIEQRELGADVPTFASGLRHALRQDPDIILVGEMRDLETTAAAITAAETGHLVLSTLHTNSSASTIERVIDMYPADQQNQIRAMLANTLQAVISQQLFKRADQPGMAPALEILVATPAVRNLIRENRTFEINTVIETNRALGMQTLDNAISQLYFNGMISREDAVARAVHPEKLQKHLAA
ncbi:MAG: type IV pili twitching motility protein PilT [Planctomycetaceae bacterium]|nr:type IV pili twitching motility protein PilT [Planctomycetaceae bacterium]